ncbi:MAG: NAD(P)/FAD-dependent oxidoreductase [Alkalilacustris sp.]
MTARVVVVGAGMAGLACARRLAEAGLSPVVIDKGRGIGGRMATRRASLPDGTALQFDHGAQYVTARGADFARLLGRMAADGAVAVWPGGTGRRRWVGLPGMSGLPRALARGLDIRQSVLVTALHALGTGWRLETDAGPMEADAVVLTVPAPQAAALLGAEHPLAGALSAVDMAPCITLMAAFPGQIPGPFLSEASDTHSLAWIAQDSAKPARPCAAVTSWVAQASADWSARHLEEEMPALIPRLLSLLADRLDVDPARVLHASTHRWRHARTRTAAGRPFLSDGTLWLGGDWCLGADVEAAWSSGHAIAEAILAGGGWRAAG